MPFTHRGIRIITRMDRSRLPTTVAAGFPSPGELWRERPLDLPSLLGFAAHDSFSLIMPSHALTAAGIVRRDAIVCSPTLAAVNRDIVYASVNAWRGVRRLLIAADVLFLVPENPATPTHPRIIVMPEDDFQVLGVALCSIHPLSVLARENVERIEARSDLTRVLGLDQLDVFATRVEGMSMRTAGITHGDVLIVSRREKAQENDIIIASYEGIFYVKRLVQVRNNIFLLSDNPLSPPMIITPDEPFQVWGVVLYCIHPLHQIVQQQLLFERGER